MFDNSILPIKAGALSNQDFTPGLLKGRGAGPLCSAVDGLRVGDRDVAMRARPNSLALGLTGHCLEILYKLQSPSVWATGD